MANEWMNSSVCTVLVLRMANRKWIETEQQPGTDEPGNMLGCCLNYFQFLWAILSTSTVGGKYIMLKLPTKRLEDLAFVVEFCCLLFALPSTGLLPLLPS